MNKKRRNIAVAIIITCVLIAGGTYQIVQWKRAFGVKDYRVVQILESTDGRTKAELIRKFEFLDLNFLIQINGRKIYTSPDFHQTYKIPFRETIFWDTTGKHLIFEVGGRRIFGYDLTTSRRLSEKELLSLQAQKTKPEDFQ